MEIDGAEAVVTGASGGLGGAIARAMHARGARVILTARREESLRKLSTELNGADVIVCDLADRKQVSGLVTRLVQTDIVVFNAALPAAGRLDDFTRPADPPLARESVTGNLLPVRCAGAGSTRKM